MKYRNLFWGIILVFLGILGLLDNFNIIYLSWHKLWNLWPLILILWGISVLPIKDMIKLSLVILTLIFTLGYIYNDAVIYKHGNYNSRTTADYNTDDPDDDTTAIKSVSSSDSNNGTFLIPYPENIKEAVLNLDAVAGKFILKNSTTNLTTFNVTDSYLAERYSYFVKTKEDKTKINISMKKHSDIDLKEHHGIAYIKLNEKPVWDIIINAGAADLDMDFSKFKVKKLNIDAGAANIDVKLGKKQPDVLVDINAGAAKITVRVPKEASCMVDINTFISGKDLDGFFKRNGKYYSQNYNENDSIKIVMTIDSAVSDLNIVRY